MSILDTIKNRTSCRTFKPVPLSPADKGSLEAFIRENDTGLDNERIPFGIIEKKAGEKPMKLDYGIIRGFVIQKKVFRHSQQISSVLNKRGVGLVPWVAISGSRKASAEATSPISYACFSFSSSGSSRTDYPLPFSVHLREWDRSTQIRTSPCLCSTRSHDCSHQGPA